MSSIIDMYIIYLEKPLIDLYRQCSRLLLVQRGFDITSWLACVWVRPLFRDTLYGRPRLKVSWPLRHAKLCSLLEYIPTERSTSSKSVWSEEYSRRRYFVYIYILCWNTLGKGLYRARPTAHKRITSGYTICNPQPTSFLAGTNQTRTA